MEQLQIKHIAPYLPYGLKWKFDGEDFTHDIVGLDITNRGVKLVSPYNDYGDCEISSGKPLLLPMSSLYKEIDGEVGIVEIFRMFGIYHENIRVTNCGLKYNDGAEWLLFDWSYSAQSFIDSDGGIYLNMESLTYLFQHHYDVFGLIGQNLAIDKSKIK